ncbi:MAG: hypothetical protein DMG43_15930 [Acidobacteria bacterium]|nr:MAG: hypothetical protein DMG43_15930 [Acidobacteriota bacterium]
MGACRVEGAGAGGREGILHDDGGVEEEDFGPQKGRKKAKKQRKDTKNAEPQREEGEVKEAPNY